MTWVAHDIRDEIVDFVRRWTERAELAATQMLWWLSLGERKFRDWRARYGQANEHNHWVPRDHWLEEWEKEKIIACYREYPLEGYRRLAFMMLDRDIVAVSPSSVYRVLKAAGLLADRWQQPTRKGRGFVQPLQPHDHWHIDFSYINVGGTLLIHIPTSKELLLHQKRWDPGAEYPETPKIYTKRIKHTKLRKTSPRVP